MKIAIVTGASSGLGRAYAQRLDKSFALDEVWLIARREERLRELSAQLKTKARVLPMDLIKPESAEELEAMLSAERPTVAVLVCAAGFGKFGPTWDLTARETDDMIALNCRAAAEVTRVCVPYLRRGSRVLEVASCAGFLPLPAMNLYAATKAFLLRYARALRWELAPRGVKVTAVCPCWIKTEFEQVARDAKGGEAVSRKVTALAQRPEAVAAWSLTVNGLGGAVATCGPAAFALRLAGKVLPSGVNMAAWEGLRRL